MTLRAMRKASILDFIAEFTKRHHYPPTVREIGEGIGLSSSSSVHRYLQVLKTEGRITFEPNKDRTICLVSKAKGEASR